MPKRLLRPPTWIALAAGLLLAVFSGSVDVRPAIAATNCSVSDSFDSEERAFLDLINAYRAQNGVAVLSVSGSLNQAAAWMAKDMADNNYFSHTDSLGRSFSTRLGQCGVQSGGGENIAAGTYRSSAQDAFTAWRNSSGHNANMLRSSFRQIGIARYYDPSSRYGWYWVTDFSTSSGGSSVPSESSSGSSGSSSTAPTPAPSPTTAHSTTTETQAAEISSPSNGSTLGYSEVFNWNAVNGARGYRLEIGTSRGSGNLLSVSLGGATAVRISGFPSADMTLYFRLGTLTSAGWVYSDSTYRLSD